MRATYTLMESFMNGCLERTVFEQNACSSCQLSVFRPGLQRTPLACGKKLIFAMQILRGTKHDTIFFVYVLFWETRANATFVMDCLLKNVFSNIRASKLREFCSNSFKYLRPAYYFNGKFFKTDGLEKIDFSRSWLQFFFGNYTFFSCSTASSLYARKLNFWFEALSSLIENTGTFD